MPPGRYSVALCVSGDMGSQEESQRTAWRISWAKGLEAAAGLSREGPPLEAASPSLATH